MSIITRFSVNSVPITDVSKIKGDSSLDDAAKADRIYGRAKINKNNNHYNEALSLYNEALKFAEKANDKQAIGNIKYEMGKMYYYYTSNMAGAIKYFEESARVNFLH